MTPEQLKAIRDMWEKARFSSVEKVNWDIIYGLQLLDEIDRLHKIIAQELSENDELGCEYTYVMALKEKCKELESENIKLKDAVEKIIELGKKSMNMNPETARSLDAHSFYLGQAIGIAMKALEEGK